MYDRHMRRRLCFERMDGETVAGVVLPPLHGMPVPEFIFMARSNHCLIPQKPSTWMYIKEDAPKLDVGSTFSDPAPHLLAKNYESFLDLFNGSDDSDDEDWEVAEDLRRPLPHERPTNVLSIDGDFVDIQETAAHLWLTILDRSATPKPQILAIGRRAKSCWFLFPKATDAVVAVGVVGDLLQDEASIRFETNEGFTDFFNNTSDRWKADDLIWEPIRDRTDHEDNAASQSPYLSSAIVHDNALSGDQNLSCVADSETSNAPTVTKGTSGDSSLTTTVHDGHQDLHISQSQDADVIVSTSANEPATPNDSQNAVNTSVDCSANATQSEDTNQEESSLNQGLLFTSILGPRRRFVSDLNHSPVPLVQHPSSDSGESMDIETPPATHVEASTLDLSPNIMLPEIDLDEWHSHSFMEIDQLPEDQLPPDNEGMPSPTSDLSELTDLPQDQEDEQNIEVMQQDSPHSTVQWERIGVDPYFDKSETHEVLFNDAGSWDAVYYAMFTFGEEQSEKQILRDKSSGKCSIHARYGFIYTEGHTEEYISCSEEEAMEDFRAEFEERTDGHSWEKRFNFVQTEVTWQSIYRWVGHSSENDMIYPYTIENEIVEINQTEE
ncbi:hypothetical protein R3P38DRAFT_2775070 [Favolaschia claudopus]|uniref:Uncharacterized protein n=1 Tax=Favolaschia claudopus TaxID=2862362 RepID=A0AAW0BVI9_9AGAR